MEKKMYIKPCTEHTEVLPMCRLLSGSGDKGDIGIKSYIPADTYYLNGGD